MKIVFFGTPAIGAGVLEKLVKSRHQIIAVVTQPDRSSGRGGAVKFSPVKELAVSEGIDVLQPEKVNDEEFLGSLEALGADLHVVAAYAQKLPNRLLEMAPMGCINVHPSLLPKYRGAAPLMAAILNGDEVSGVTIMKMAEKMDAGDILLQEKIILDPKETTVSLEAKATDLGGSLLLRAIDMIEDGSITATPQEEPDGAYVRQLTKEAGLIDWMESAALIERKTRAYTPWPGTYTTLDGKILKIIEADVYKDGAGAEASPEDVLANASANAASQTISPGTISRVSRNGFCVMTGDGELEPRVIQLEGKKRMEVSEFLRGRKLETGMQLGK